MVCSSAMTERFVEQDVDAAVPDVLRVGMVMDMLMGMNILLKLSSQMDYLFELCFGCMWN